VLQIFGTSAFKWGMHREEEIILLLSTSFKVKVCQGSTTILNQNSSSASGKKIIKT